MLFSHNDLNNNTAALQLLLQSMENSILYDRLNDQTRNLKIIRHFILFINNNFKRKPIIKTISLYQHVVINIGNLITERNKISLSAYTISEKRSQSLYHLGNFKIIIHKRLPTDRLQRIIKKMRIDLTLQCRKLCLLVKDRRRISSRPLCRISFNQIFHLCNIRNTPCSSYKFCFFAFLLRQCIQHFLKTLKRL